MPATEPLCQLIGIKPWQLSKEESIFLEMELFSFICKELEYIFKINQQNYFQFLKFNIEKEYTMLDKNLAQLLIKDILRSGQYTLEGIARYIDIHEDAVHEVYIGRNTNPSAMLLLRTIELHRSIRRDFYYSMMKKIMQKVMIQEIHAEN